MRTGLLLLLLPALARAQAVDVTGMVRDSATARPLAGAALVLAGTGYQQATQTDETGAYRFVGARPGSYVLQVRRLGYAPWRGAVDVTSGRASVNISLARVTALDTVRVRPGMAIFGAVGDYRDLHPLANAEVQVVGVGGRVRTDTAGRFFVSLNKPGAYVVRVRHEGFEPQTVSATVPKDDAVELSVLLDAATGDASNKYEMAWNEFGDRMRMRGSRSALVSRSELMRKGNVSALDALMQSPTLIDKNIRFGDVVCVFVDGLPSVTTPIWKFNTAAIEAIEVYPADRGADPTSTLARKSRGSECHPTGLVGTLAGGPEVAKFVVIWLRR